MSFRPLGDRVLIEPIKPEEKTKGGIFLPDVAQGTPDRGTVVSVGSGRVDGSERIPVEVTEGDVVLYSRYGGTEVEVDGKTLTLLRESDILAILV